MKDRIGIMKNKFSEICKFCDHEMKLNNIYNEYLVYRCTYCGATLIYCVDPISYYWEEPHNKKIVGLKK